MCRIASLFLLQRQKGSIPGDARDFNNIETRAVNFFFFLQDKAPKKIHAILTEILEEHAPPYATIQNWMAQFKRSDFSYKLISVPSRVPHNTSVPSALEDGTEGCLETSIRNDLSTLCKIAKEHRSHLHRGRSVKEGRNIKFGREMDHKYA